GLGPLLIQLGATAVGALRVVNLGENYLQRLVDDGGETAVMSIWGGHGPVVVRVREPLSKLIQIRVAVGSALPVVSAQGMIFMAWNRDAAAVRRLLEHLAPAQRSDLMREIDRSPEQSCDQRAGGRWNSHRGGTGFRSRDGGCDARLRRHHRRNFRRSELRVGRGIARGGGATLT